MGIFSMLDAGCIARLNCIDSHSWFGFSASPLSCRRAKPSPLKVRGFLMPHPFNHPSSQKLLGDLSSVFKSDYVFQKKDRHIIFLCGGSVQPRKQSLRNKFWKYSRSELKKCRIFLAETVVQDVKEYEDPEFLNIADFESFLANVSDCILIFPESPGSIAELGYFSNNKKLIKKLLAVKDLNLQHDSFINIGPLDKVERESNFQTVFVDRKAPNFDQIKNRLYDRLPTGKAKKFTFKRFTEYDHKEKLYILFQFIIVFRAMNLSGLIYCLNEIFGRVNKKEIQHFISFLVASRHIKRAGRYSNYYVPISDSEAFIDFRRTDIINELKAASILYYQKHHEETYRIIGEKTDDN